MPRPERAENGTRMIIGLNLLSCVARITRLHPSSLAPQARRAQAEGILVLVASARTLLVTMTLVRLVMVPAAMTLDYQKRDVLTRIRAWLADNDLI